MKTQITREEALAVARTLRLRRSNIFFYFDHSNDKNYVTLTVKDEAAVFEFAVVLEAGEGKALADWLNQQNL